MTAQNALPEDGGSAPSGIGCLACALGRTSCASLQGAAEGREGGGRAARSAQMALARRLLRREERSARRTVDALAQARVVRLPAGRVRVEAARRRLRVRVVQLAPADAGQGRSPGGRPRTARTRTRHRATRETSSVSQGGQRLGRLTEASTRTGAGRSVRTFVSSSCRASYPFCWSGTREMVTGRGGGGGVRTTSTSDTARSVAAEGRLTLFILVDVAQRAHEGGVAQEAEEAGGQAEARRGVSHRAAWPQAQQGGSQGERTSWACTSGG